MTELKGGLVSLSIKNFAVISELKLEFGPGLTVFTGETGAGKSIVIEALGFLMGQRASPDWLRAGAAKLEVEALLGGAKKSTIRRELDASGRTKAWIDGKPAALPELKALAERLVDFHGQHEHQTLLKPAVQLELLDGFGGLEKDRGAVEATYRRWKELQAQLAALSMSEEERLRLVDLYRFQVAEIDQVSPKPGEEEELEAALPRLKHAAKLGELAEQVHQLLQEQEGSAEELVSKAEHALSEMARLDPSLEAGLEALARGRAALGEASELLSPYRGAEAGPEGLDELLGRQDALAKLKKKYGATLEEVAAYRDRTAKELARLENHAERSEDVQKQLSDTAEALSEQCDHLHKLRMKAAKKLSERAAAELKDLGLAAARFSVSVELEEGAFTPSGANTVEFLIAPNPGEGLKSLRSVASGGELSRVMLALKTVLARQDRVALLVFDEVDAGVGGAVGRAVGEKLSELGAARQVLCVTHLPQVAGFARTHFAVSKAVSGGRTSTKVERLDGEKRLEAIATMLGGKPTEASRRHAKELLESL